MKSTPVSVNNCGQSREALHRTGHLWFLTVQLKLPDTTRIGRTNSNRGIEAAFFRYKKTSLYFVLL
jgi:hypothetical protein